MRISLYITVGFSLATVKTLSLSLTFGILIIRSLGIGLFGILIWNSLGFLDMDVSFLPKIREVFSHYLIISSNMFLPLSRSLLLPLVFLMLSHKSLIYLHFSSLFFLFAALIGFVPLLVFRFTDSFFCSV